MRFTIDSAEFKIITERAAIVSNKKGPVVYVTGINLIADAEKQKVTIRATNLTSYALVFTDAAVVKESGNVYIEAEDLRRLYNIVGDITVESDGKTLLVRSSKKQGEISASTPKELLFPTTDENLAFAADKEDMLDTFSKLSCCLAGDERPPYTGFNVADVSFHHRIAALDGYRAAVRGIEWKFRDGLNITIPGFIVKELTKVSANKKEEEIAVYADEKYVRFVGLDFVYITRLLEGKYLDVDSLLVPKGATYKFEVKADKLFAIAKEYSGFLSKVKQPMFLCYKNGKYIAAAESLQYRTSDVLEISNECGVPEDLIYSVNSHFLKDLMAIFGKETVVIESGLHGAEHNTWLIRGENGYSALILPVRPLNDMSGIRKLIASA